MSADLTKPIILGITGGVASGKSTIAQIFKERGACVVSSDVIARDLLAPSSEMTQSVLALFGTEFAMEGVAEPQIDRAKLARRIFSDAVMRLALGALMHPEIHRRTLAEIKSALNNPDCAAVAVEVPLLYENNLDGLMDAVLVAYCPETIQVQRLMARRSDLGEEDALRQIRSQMPLSEKKARANYVIDTNRPIETVHSEADRLFDSLTTPKI